MFPEFELPEENGKTENSSGLPGMPIFLRSEYEYSRAGSPTRSNLRTCGHPAKHRLSADDFEEGVGEEVILCSTERVTSLDLKIDDDLLKAIQKNHMLEAIRRNDAVLQSQQRELLERGALNQAPSEGPAASKAHAQPMVQMEAPPRSDDITRLFHEIGDASLKEQQVAIYANAVAKDAVFPIPNGIPAAWAASAAVIVYSTVYEALKPTLVQNHLSPAIKAAQAAIEIVRELKPRVPAIAIASGKMHPIFAKIYKQREQDDKLKSAANEFLYNVWDSMSHHIDLEGLLNPTQSVEQMKTVITNTISAKIVSLDQAVPPAVPKAITSDILVAIGYVLNISRATENAVLSANMKYKPIDILREEPLKDILVFMLRQPNTLRTITTDFDTLLCRVFPSMPADNRSNYIESTWVELRRKIDEGDRGLPLRLTNFENSPQNIAELSQYLFNIISAITSDDIPEAYTPTKQEMTSKLAQALMLLISTGARYSAQASPHAMQGAAALPQQAKPVLFQCSTRVASPTAPNNGVAAAACDQTESAEHQHKRSKQ